MAKRFPNPASVFAAPAFDAVVDPRKMFVFNDDFVTGLTTTGNIGKGWTLTGTGASVAYGGAEDAAGVLTLTAATTGFAAGVSLPDDVVNIGDNGLYLAVRFRIPTALTNREVRIGLADAAPTGTVPVQGVSLQYDAAADADDWHVLVDDNASPQDVTASDSIAAPAAATWYVVQFAVTSSSVYVELDGEPLLDTAVTTGIPAATTGLTPYVYVGDGTNGQTLEVDYVSVWQRIARAGKTVE